MHSQTQWSNQTCNERWIALLPMALKDPMLCKDVVPATTNYGSYSNASKQGAGSVWFGIKENLPPIVWWVQFPLEIQAQVVSSENPKGTISNFDLEMVGLLLQWLVLENFANLTHKHVACWCNNTPTIVWASKLLATKATRAAHLLWILALHMMQCKASPLTTLHVLGEMNKLANFASRSFYTHPEAQPSMYCEKWISWPTLHPDHFTHIQKHNLFSPNFKTISCYHRKLPGLHASCQTSYLEESFQLC